MSRQADKKGRNRGVEQVEERERGMEPGGTGVVIRKIPKNLKLSLTGSVERQARHRPDRLSKLRTGSVGTDQLGRVRKPVCRPVRRKGQIGAKTGRPSERYSARNIFRS